MFPDESPQIRLQKGLPLAARLRAELIAVLFGTVIFSAGCAVNVSQKHVVTPAQIRPALQASREPLIAAFNTQAAADHSVNAAVTMMPVAGSTYSGLIEQYHEVEGFILASSPQKIRVIGQAPVLAKNIFDMTSDGKEFRIFIPSKNQFLMGPTNLERPSNKPLENLRPQHILEALFWNPIDPQSQVLFEEAEAAPERYYVLTQVRPAAAGLEIARKIWFDRANLRVARLQLYGPGGRFESDVTYSDWQSAAAAGEATTPASGMAGLFPRQIHIRRPQQDYELTITITRLTLNSEIPDERFALEQPAGSELVRLDAGAEDHP
jgi:outer membrane lipoprotein-sorting protein